MAKTLDEKIAALDAKKTKLIKHDRAKTEIVEIKRMHGARDYRSARQRVTALSEVLDELIGMEPTE